MNTNAAPTAPAPIRPAATDSKAPIAANYWRAVYALTDARVSGGDVRTAARDFQLACTLFGVETSATLREWCAGRCEARS